MNKASGYQAVVAVKGVCLQSLGCVLGPCACGCDEKLNSCHMKQKPSIG